MKRFNRTMIVSFLLVLCMVFSVTGVFADEGTVALTVGSITLIPDGDGFAFANAMLNGNTFSSTDEAGVGSNNTTWSLVDARGTGVGWTVSIATSNITGLFNSVGAPVVLTLTNSTTPDYNQFGMHAQIVQADVTIKTGAYGSTPVSGLTTPVSGAAFATTGALAVVQAAVDTGMGGYDIDPLFTLYMPAGTYAGTGTLTITVTKTDAAS